MSQPLKHAVNQLREGTVLDGRYEIAEELGQGGFATVYRARQLKIDRDVAVKVLGVTFHPGRDEMTRQRFLKEAKLAARIDDPGVVTIYDYGIWEATGQPYIVMELLRGRDLADELRLHGPMAPARLMPLFLQALEALAAGHDLGIVHKDLKPSNLFLCYPNTPRETIKILDYGVARVDSEDGSGRMTATGGFIGTPQYLAPEYIADNTVVSPALDVYQMGLILAELLTGRPVVDEDNAMRCIVIHSSGELSIHRSLVTEPLGPILRRSINPDPARRYPDARAFAQALRDLDPAGIQVDPDWVQPRQVNSAAFDRSFQESDAFASFNRPASGDVPLGTAPTVDGDSQERDTAAAMAFTADPMEPVTVEPVAPRRGWIPYAAAVLAVVLLGGLAWVFASSGDPAPETVAKPSKARAAGAAAGAPTEGKTDNAIPPPVQPDAAPVPPDVAGALAQPDGGDAVAGAVPTAQAEEGDTADPSGDGREPPAGEMKEDGDGEPAENEFAGEGDEEPPRDSDEPAEDGAEGGAAPADAADDAAAEGGKGDEPARKTRSNRRSRKAKAAPPADAPKPRPIKAFAD